MDWQQLVAIAIVVVTAGTFVLGWLRRKPSKGVCGSGCGCPGASTTAPKISVTYHARKGERPEIITRMS